MIVEFHYPMSSVKSIEFIPGEFYTNFLSLSGEMWYKAVITCRDTSKFSRLNKKLLVRSLDQSLKVKHQLSKCNIVEELICHLELLED